MDAGGLGLETSNTFGSNVIPTPFPISNNGTTNTTPNSSFSSRPKSSAFTSNTSAPSTSTPSSTLASPTSNSTSKFSTNNPVFNDPTEQLNTTPIILTTPTTPTTPLSPNQPNNVTLSTMSDGPSEPGSTLTSTTTLVVTMTIPLGTMTSGTLEWSTTVQTTLAVQLNLPSALDLSNTNHQNSENSDIIGIVFGVISFVLLLFAGMFVILRRHFRKKYSKDRLPHFEKFVRQALEDRGPYSPTIAQVGISHLRRNDPGSLEDLSEETAVRSPILEYRHGRNSPVEVPQLYTDQTSLSTASSFVTVSSVPVPFYQRIKEARRAGTIRKYTM